MQLTQILVRFGWQGAVGKFSLPETEVDLESPAKRGNRLLRGIDQIDNLEFQRGESVVIQSPRGLEVGEILGACQPDDSPTGKVVRNLSPEDRILLNQLRRFSSLAHARCAQWLQENGMQATLLEVEPLLDGQTLYFHFLSGVDGLIQQQVETLAQLYENEVAASDFAHKLAEGCGPGCGTDKATGRGCSSCTNCRICVAKP